LTTTQVLANERSASYYQRGMGPTAFINRYYTHKPVWGDPGGWYDGDDPAEWEVVVDHGHNELGHVAVERCWFDSVDTAIEWARQRSAIVLVRLGSSEEYVYSAGSTRANERVDNTGNYYPEWPPDNWPDYRGPAAERRHFESTYVPTELPDEPNSEPETGRRYSYKVVLLALDETSRPIIRRWGARGSLSSLPS
jgi:hypothetical protein